MGIKDDTVEIAKSIVGDRLLVFSSEDRPSFRNFGIEAANWIGASWICTLDTDERIPLEGVDIKNVLSQVDGDVVLVWHKSGAYRKERFFRGGIKDPFVGNIHEYVPPDKFKVWTIKGENVWFDELEKSPEEARAKAESALPLLQEWVDKEPENPRWWHLLGDSLAGVKRYEEAVEAFIHCATLKGREEAGWACFRAATIMMALGRREEAMCTAAAGLGRYPAMPELAWVAGEAAMSLGEPAMAMAWAKMALVNKDVPIERSWYAFPFGMEQGPLQLLARATAALSL